MEVHIEETSTCSRKISVKVGGDAVNAAMADALKKVAREAVIPGFRPGKAPKAMLKQRFAGLINERVMDSLINKTLQQAMVEHDIKFIEVTGLLPGKLSESEEFSYTANVDVIPTVALQQHKGFKITQSTPESIDEALDKALDKLRDEHARVVPVTDRDVIARDDIVLLDYHGTLDGGEAPDGLHAHGASLHIGENLLEDFNQGLIGKKVPGEYKFDVQFPENYGEESLAGKCVHFSVTTHELKHKELPALDDDFAIDVGNENLDELKQEIRKRLEDEISKRTRQELRQSLITKLIEANPFDVPSAMISQQAERLVDRAEEQMQQMFRSMTKLSPEHRAAMLEESRPNAEVEVRSGLLLIEISKAENIEISDAEIDAETERLLAGVKNAAPSLIQSVNSTEFRNNLRFKLQEDKTVDFLISHSEIETLAAEHTATR